MGVQEGSCAELVMMLIKFLPRGRLKKRCDCDSESFPLNLSTVLISRGGPDLNDSAKTNLRDLKRPQEHQNIHVWNFILEIQPL